MPVQLWAIFSHLHLALLYNTTMQLYTICNTIPMHVQLSWHEHPTVAILRADNMHYMTYASTPCLNLQH